MYAAFESSLKPEGDDDVTTGLTTEKKKERVYQTHEAASYWYKIVSIVPDFHMPEKKIYVGKDAAEHMLTELKEDAEKIFTKYIKKYKSMELTLEEQQHFDAATECHICGGKFTVDKRFEIIVISWVISEVLPRTDVI